MMCLQEGLQEPQTSSEQVYAVSYPVEDYQDALLVRRLSLSSNYCLKRSLSSHLNLIDVLVLVHLWAEQCQAQAQAKADKSGYVHGVWPSYNVVSYLACSCEATCEVAALPQVHKLAEDHQHRR